MPKKAILHKTSGEQEVVKMKKLARTLKSSRADIAMSNAHDFEHQLKFVNPKSVREQLRTALKDGSFQNEKQ